MAKSIATIEGTALVPGVSKNGRYYSPEAIAKAVGRLSERIADGSNPAVMLTSHGADDDSRRIVGRLASISLAADGSARFAAQIADTDEGRKIASLVDTRDGPAFLKGVSIRGNWASRVRNEIRPDGTHVQTADDLEISGLDFTHKPGVPGAEVDTFTPAASNAPSETTSDGRVFITESVQEVLVTMISEETEAMPALTEADGTSDGGPFADPGYQADKKKRYDLSTKIKAKAAWSYIAQADNARLYTSAQLKRIKGRIVKALKGYGVTVATAEGWLIDPAAQLTESLAECWGMDASTPGSLYLSLTNGPTTVTVSSNLLDPHDLGLVGRAAMAGACNALMALDPDMDADIDVPGAEPEDTDSDMESAPTEPTLTAAVEAAPQTSAPEPPAADPAQEEEPAMAESIPTTPAASPGVHLTDDQFKAMLDRLAPQAIPAPAAVEAAPAPAAPAVEAAPVAAPVVEAAVVVTPIAEATPVVTESTDERMARLIAEGIAAALPAAVQEHVEQNGPPARKGLAAQVNEHTAPVAGGGIPEGWPQKPLHEYSDEEYRQFVSPATVAAVLGDRAQA